MAESYNQIVSEFGYNKSLLMALNMLDYYGMAIQTTESNYSGFINQIMYEGVSIKPEQTDYNYYKEIFKEYLKEPLLTDNDSIFWQQRDDLVERKKAFVEIENRFMQLRDNHLLKQLKQALKNHDRVFI